MAQGPLMSDSQILDITRLKRDGDVDGLLAAVDVAAGTRPSTGQLTRAITALASFEDERIPPALFAILTTDSGNGVRLTAMKALIRSNGDSGVELAIDSLEVQDVEGVLVLTVEALHKASPGSAETQLTRLLSHNSGAVRAAAARALQHATHQATIDALVFATRDERRDVRVAAIKALVEIGDDKHAPEMRLAAGAEPWAVRRILLRAIDRM